MFKVASIAGNGSNSALLSMSSNVEGNIHGGIINNTIDSKQTVKFTIDTVEFIFNVEANSTTDVGKLNVPVGTAVLVDAPVGVSVSVSYIELPIDTSVALSKIQTQVEYVEQCASEAKDSETNAKSSEDNAGTSEDNALISENNAKSSELLAQKWAENAEDLEVITGGYSAYHWARKAQAVASGDVVDDTTLSNLLTWSSDKVNRLDVANVKLTGNQIIDGNKVFTGRPIVPSPIENNHAVNKEYVDSNISQLSAANKNYVDSKPTLPIGAVLNGYTIYDNCIVAFGGEFNRADYPKLWAYLEANPTLVKTQAQWTTENTTNGMCGYFSSGNGTTTFRVPNLDKAFLRPDSRTVGSYQADEFKSHSHLFPYGAIGTLSTGGGQGTTTSSISSPNVYTYSTGGTETRPKNIAVLPLIVAK